KLRLLALTPRTGTPIPVPLRDTLAGLPGALLPITSVAFCAPAWVGVKRIARVCVPPGASGPIPPLGSAVKAGASGPVRVILLIVNAAVPVLLRVMFCTALPLTVTPPKLRLAALTLSAGMPTPVPLRGTLRGLPGALLVITNEACRLPGEVGEK